MRVRLWLLCTLLSVPAAALANKPHQPRDKPKTENVLVVTATAYNSDEDQTDDEEDIAAWGDRIQPGMKIIAVSRDLLAMGLKRNTKVRIDGLPGEWRVLDKMNRRWKRRIDLYMGEDEDAAWEWGVRKVTIRW